MLQVSLLFSVGGRGRWIQCASFQVWPSCTVVSFADKFLANSLKPIAPLCNKPISNQNELTRCSVASLHCVLTPLASPCPNPQSPFPLGTATPATEHPIHPCSHFGCGAMRTVDMSSANYGREGSTLHSSLYILCVFLSPFLPFSM